MKIYIYIYMYVYVYEWDSNPWSRAYRTHALTTELSGPTIRCA